MSSCLSVVRPWTMSWNVVSPSGTRKRTQNGTPAAAIASERSGETARQARSYFQPSPWSEASCRLRSISSGGQKQR